MGNRLTDLTCTAKLPVLDALKKIDANLMGFLVVVDEAQNLLGTLTDGDIRRALIKGATLNGDISEMYQRSCKYVSVTDGIGSVIELFKKETIKFLPILDGKRVVNVITKSQMHTLLLEDLHVGLDYDFFELNDNILNTEIFPRPWGFYKTTLFNDYCQSKIISVRPSGQLSLQLHRHRSEYWIIIHGKGEICLGDDVRTICAGDMFYIPKGVKHRLKNIDASESLIVSEVQLGDYFGEDDIIRFEDIYGRI